MEGEDRDRACGEKSATIEAGGRVGARRALQVRDVPDGARLGYEYRLSDRCEYTPSGALDSGRGLFLVPARR
jgi:hypothetical protein